MISPPSLKTGDKVAIVSTARKVSSGEITFAKETIESWGYEVIIGESIDKEADQFAGTDELRAADLQRVLDMPEVRAVFMARGGYGTVRIVDQLDFTRFQEDPKWLIGFSDVTVLHNHLHKHLDTTTLHASMPFNFPKNTEEALVSLQTFISGGQMDYQIGGHRLNKMGEASGLLTGGNLSIIYSLMSSSSEVDTQGKILFLEDLDEYLYHIDRMIMNLKRADKLQGLAGLIVGGMTEMNDNEVPFGKSAEEIIKEHVEQYDYPVCFGFPAGHIPNNLALKMGSQVVLNVADECSLKEI
ncbi:MAG: LD-carboxypeptidase [Bacteroidetes bacterium]|nr:LD-carboxypeptidase [Bacteroidota bacterium]